VGVRRNKKMNKIDRFASAIKSCIAQCGLEFVPGEKINFSFATDENGVKTGKASFRFMEAKERTARIRLGLRETPVGDWITVPVGQKNLSILVCEPELIVNGMFIDLGARVEWIPFRNVCVAHREDTFNLEINWPKEFPDLEG
jgi:hypothetical protein